MNKWNLRSLDLKRSQMRTNFLINSLNIVVHTRGNRRSRLISVDNHHSGVYLVQKQEQEEEKQRQEEGKKKLKVAGEKVLGKWKKQLMKKRLQQEQLQGVRKNKDEVKSRDALFSPFESYYKGQLSRSSSRQLEQENHLKINQQVGNQLNRGCSQVIGEQEEYNLDRNKRTIEYSGLCSSSSQYEKGKEKDGAEGEKRGVNGQKYRRVQSNRVPSQSQQEQHSHEYTDIKKQRNSDSLTHLQQYQKYQPHPKGYTLFKGQYQTLQQSSRNSINQHLTLNRRKINNQKGSRNILTTQQNGIKIVLSVGKRPSIIDRPQKQQQTNRINAGEPSVHGNIPSMSLKYNKVPIRLPEVRSISYSQSLQGHSISLRRSIKSINNSIRKSLESIEKEGQARKMHDWKIQQRKKRIRLEEGEDQYLPQLSEQEKKEQMIRRSLGGQGQNKEYSYNKGKVFSNLLPQGPSQISLGHHFTPKYMPSFIAIHNNINPQKKTRIGRYRTSPKEEEGRLSPWPVAKETILGRSFKNRI